MDPLGVLAGVLLATWGVLLDAGAFLLFGFLVAGLLYVLLPRDRVLLHLGESSVSAVIKASLIGVPLPLCSCGVIPAVAELRRKGASKGASLAFLISTPESGIDSISLSWTLLDPVLTVVRPLAAFATATVAGVASNLLEPPEPRAIERDEGCILCGDCLSCFPHEHTAAQKGRAALAYGFVELLGELAPSLLLGLLISGAISYLVPPELVGPYLGSGIWAMVAMLLIGVPLYVCATSSTPVVASLISKGMSPGAGIVFLLAGPSTNMATILMVRERFGARSLAVYLGTIAACSLAAGLLVDQYYAAARIEPASSIGAAGEALPDWLRAWSALVLLALLAWGAARTRREHGGQGDACCVGGHGHGEEEGGGEGERGHAHGEDDRAHDDEREGGDDEGQAHRSARRGRHGRHERACEHGVPRGGHGAGPSCGHDDGPVAHRDTGGRARRGRRTLTRA